MADSGAAIVNKRGAATLIGLVQAILVFVAGVYGTHGIVSVLTYTLPGVVDLFYFSRSPKGREQNRHVRRGGLLPM